MENEKWRIDDFPKCVFLATNARIFFLWKMKNGELMIFPNVFLATNARLGKFSILHFQFSIIQKLLLKSFLHLSFSFFSKRQPLQIDLFQT